MFDPMSWYKVAFTEAEVEEGAPGRLEKGFQQTYAAAHSPKEAALFSNELAAEGIEYYFSPEAGRIAEALLTQYGGSPCGPPAFDDVRLALGHRATGERLLAHHDDV